MNSMNMQMVGKVLGKVAGIAANAMIWTYVGKKFGKYLENKEDYAKDKKDGKFEVEKKDSTEHI